MFAQFAPYHIDRIAAVAARLPDVAVRAVEVATMSRTYAWQRSGAVPGAEKITLFADAAFETVSARRKLMQSWRALGGSDCVLVGVPYSDPAIIALSWLLRFKGRPPVLMSESKADDAPRRWWREWGKRLLLSAYGAAIVGGPRQAAYMKALGFKRRPVLQGYDTISVARVGLIVAGAAEPDWSERPFLYVGRFVAKKNLAALLAAYARYAERAGASARRLVMAGDGPLRNALQRQARDLGIADRVDWPGFLDETGVARTMNCSLALLLVSTTEQWGLVVNEACAAGLPAIVSTNVGARETLVRDGVTGYVVPATDPEAISMRMQAMAANEGAWRAMRAAALRQAEAGDVARFAEAVAKLIAQSGAGR